MPTSISSSVTGIAGFDVTAAVDGLLSFQKLDITRAKDKQTAETAKQDAFVAINSAMLSFKSTALAMADSTAFFSYGASLGSSSASVPASSLLDVSGTDSVSAGKHTIIVQQIAQEERISSSIAAKDSLGAALISDASAAGLTGSFQIGAATVSVVAGDSLQEIAASINQLNTGAAATGVSASVLKVADNDFRLVLASDTTGVAGFSLSGADLDVGGALANLQLGAVGQTNARQTLQTPQDAQVSIDGLSLFRSSNTISDALSGVTLNLKQADPTVTVSMDVSVDTGALTANVQAFVDAYNQVQSLVNEQFSFDSATGTTGVLAGEGMLTSIQSTLSNSLLQSVPGLASDRSSMVLIGVEPDEKGQLIINTTLFDKFLTTDPTAIRDVFVANGSSSNSQLQFLTAGLNTPSGTYQVNVTQAASKASVLSTIVGASLGVNESITFTDISTGTQSIINLTSLQNQAQIIAAMNSEFDKISTEQHQTSGSLGASGITTSSSLSSLGLGVVAGDTVSITGTTRLGSAVSSSFSVLDPVVDTVGTLLSSIQSAFDQQVVASLNASGNIVVTDSQSGSSLLTVNLTANNESGGTPFLDFGTDTVVTEGRYAMNLVALAQANSISVTSKNFGTSSDFSVVESANALGMNGTFNGSDVAGTINGSTTTGSGQLLIGNSGNEDGLAVLYTGTTTGSAGNDIILGMGLAAKMEGVLDLFSNPFTGLIQGSISSSQSTFDDLTKRIIDLETQLEKQRSTLTNSFTLMQTTMSTLQNSGNFLTAQMNAQNANN